MSPSRASTCSTCFLPSMPCRERAGSSWRNQQHSAGAVSQRARPERRAQQQHGRTCTTFVRSRQSMQLVRNTPPCG